MIRSTSSPRRFLGEVAEGEGGREGKGPRRTTAEDESLTAGRDRSFETRRSYIRSMAGARHAMPGEGVNRAPTTSSRGLGDDEGGAASREAAGSKAHASPVVATYRRPSHATRLRARARWAS